jgi:putative transcriptional regulator
MMQLQPGTFIQSTEALSGTYFSGATIFISGMDAQGATGFVINKPFGRSLHELAEFRHSIPFPLYAGGPVDEAHLFLLHQRPNIIEGGVPIAKGIYFGGNMQAAVTGINNHTLTSGDIKILVGYCGWDSGELEAEIEEGSWQIITPSKEALFG